MASYNRPFSHKETLAATYVRKCSWLGSIFDKKHKMWDQLTTSWSLDRAEKHYSLKEQPLNMPLGSQNPYAKRAYSREVMHGSNNTWGKKKRLLIEQKEKHTKSSCLEFQPIICLAGVRLHVCTTCHCPLISEPCMLTLPYLLVCNACMHIKQGSFYFAGL